MLDADVDGLMLMAWFGLCDGLVSVFHPAKIRYPNTTGLSSPV
jgi:hypothetical protein